MSRAVAKIASITVLLAVAGVCGYAAHSAFTERPRTTGGAWAHAAALAQRAERTKAELPALRIRQQAIQLFTNLAYSGPPTVRSRAAMLAGLLMLGTAGADPAQQKQALALSAESLRRAVRLDRSNDDAAFDLELLLSRAKASGRPVGQVPQRPRKHKGKPSPGEAGHGY